MIRPPQQCPRGHRMLVGSHARAGPVLWQIKNACQPERVAASPIFVSPQPARARSARVRSQSVERQRRSLVNNAVEVGVLEQVSASRRMPKDTPRGQLGHPQAHSAAQPGVRGPDQHPRVGFEAILPAQRHPAVDQRANFFRS
jgi:hypothetical protein